MRLDMFQAHQGSAHSLAVSGSHVVSCGTDRVVRLWSRSSEPLVLEDEREEERAQQDETALVTGADTVVPGHAATKLPSRKTVGAEKAVSTYTTFYLRMSHLLHFHTAFFSNMVH